MSMHHELRERLSTAYTLCILNCILYLITSSLLKPSTSPQSISLANLLDFSKVFNLVGNLIGFYIASLLHVILSVVISRSVVLAMVNRVVLVAQMSLLNFDTFNSGIVIREFTILVLAMVIVKIFTHHLSGRNGGFSIKDLGIILNSIVQGIRNLRKGVVRADLVSYMLAFHGLVVSALLSYTLFIYDVQGQRAAGSSLLVSFMIVPLIQILILIIISQNIEQTSLIIPASIISGTGLFGTIPTLLVINHVGLQRLTLMRVEPAEESKGIYMGMVLAGLTSKISEKEEWYWTKVSFPLYLDLDKLNTPHMIIIGSSGAGKTTLAKHIVQEAKRRYKYNLIIIDLHGEYRDLREKLDLVVVDASICSVNPLTLGNASPRDRAGQVAHIISVIFNLGLLQRKMIEEVIMEAYNSRGISQGDPSTWSRDPPTLSELVEVCEKLSQYNPEYNRVLPYLEMLSENLSARSWLSVDVVLEHDTIIDLSKVASDFAKTIFIDTFMYLLLDKMYSMGGRKVQLLIDEARSLMPRAITREIINRLFVESRKFGFSLIVVSQEINRIPRDFINNAGVRIFFLLNDPRSLEEASKILSGISLREKMSTIAESLRTLKQHMYMIHVTGSNNIYIVSSPVRAGKMEK